MADIYKGELQDNLGNTVYPHTEADVVFCADGKTAQEKLTKYEDSLGSVTGKTDSLEVSDSNILATSKTVNILNANIGKIRTYVGSDGKLHFVNASGADTVLPFNRVGNMVYLGTGTSFNVKSLYPTVDYTKLTANSFIVGFQSANASGGTMQSTSAKTVSSTITKNYNSSTGVLTLSVSTGNATNSAGVTLFQVTGQTPFACMYVE